MLSRWKKQDLPQAPHVFSGSQLSLSDEPKTPLQYFSMFFTDKLIQDIVGNTNLYSVQKTCKSVNTNVQETEKIHWHEYHYGGYTIALSL